MKKMCDSVQRFISHLEDHWEEEEMKAEELEDKMPARYVDRFIPNAIGNFDPEDKVWVVKTKHDSVKCDTCGGIGKVRIVDLNNDEFICPSCSGRGTTSKSYYTVEEDEIKNIYVDMNVKRIFETEAEAQKECNRLNKERENKYA